MIYFYRGEFILLCKELEKRFEVKREWQLCKCKYFNMFYYLFVTNILYKVQFSQHHLGQKKIAFKP